MGHILADDEEQKIRYKICEECEFFNSISSRCKKCGCFMKIKTRLDSSKCAMGYWEDETRRQQVASEG